MIVSRRKLLTGAVAMSAYAALPAEAHLNGSLPCDIWALIGDSNTYSGLAQDGTAGYNPAIDVTNNRCLEYRNPWQTPTTKTYIAIAQDQFDYNNSTPSGGAPAGSIGPGLTFIRDYWVPNQLAPGRNVMIVAAGYGGTGLFNIGTSSSWYPPGSGGGTGWVATGNTGAIARVNAAVALNPGNKLVGMLWCSGANDADAGVSQANYNTAWGLMQVYAQANFTGGTNLPILVTGLCPTAYLTSQPVWLALAALTSNYHNVGYVDTSNATNFGGQTAVHYHFTATAQRNIGGLGGTGGFAAAYQNLSP
jgi:hypothetical protein